jgi:DNA-binding response OmpR family regulator
MAALVSPASLAGRDEPATAPKLMRVLIVEDEPDLAGAIARGLRRQGLAVDVAGDGIQALEKTHLAAYDVVVLDRDLPALHGDEVCRRLHLNPPSPLVLMLTAAGELEDRVAGLSLGADDYMAKPFAFSELLARVLALSRRGVRSRPPVLRRGDLELDTNRREARRAGRRVDLTAKELGVLEALVLAQGAPLSAEQLLMRVWDENADPFTAAVRITMSSLRRKLGEPPMIETRVGVGYRIEVAE